MFLGAGSAATGIADLLKSALMKHGLSEKEALKRLNFCDIDGLLVKGRKGLMEHNLPYAHDMNSIPFKEAISTLEPDVLIGATGSGGTFDQEVIEAMSKVNERPVIFALSNPTSKAECTAEQAYSWSDGKAIFVSGSPFNPVEYKGKTLVPGQGNNAYIFPGLGMGLLVSKAKGVNDQLLLAAAETLADQVTEEDLAQGKLYPSLKNIRQVSHAIACRVANLVYELGLTRKRRPTNLEDRIRKNMYDPKY